MSRELDEQIAHALGFQTLWADGGFGETLYLHDAGAIRESPNVTSNCRVLGARWERLRINGEVGEYHVRYAPHWSSNYQDARDLEDEIERRGLHVQYVEALNRLVGGYATEFPGTYSDCVMLPNVFFFLRATPEQRARAFLEAVKRD